MSDTKFTVFMHHDLVNKLDETFSPVDGIVAIDQMFIELPRLHLGTLPKRPRNRVGRNLKVFRGNYHWFDLGFSYVQVGNALHVVELWRDYDWRKPNRTDIDVVLGTREEEWEPRQHTLNGSELIIFHTSDAENPKMLQTIVSAKDEEDIFGR